MSLNLLYCNQSVAVGLVTLSTKTIIVYLPYLFTP